MHLKSLVIKLGDTKLQKEKSFMLKNLDLLASLIAEKNKICRTVCESMPLNWKDVIRHTTKLNHILEETNFTYLDKNLNLPT